MPHRTTNQQFGNLFSTYSKQNIDNHIKFKPDSLTIRKQLNSSLKSFNHQHLYDHTNSMK